MMLDGIVDQIAQHQFQWHAFREQDGHWRLRSDGKTLNGRDKLGHIRHKNGSVNFLFGIFEAISARISQ